MLHYRCVSIQVLQRGILTPVTSVSMTVDIYHLFITASVPSFAVVSWKISMLMVGATVAINALVNCVLGYVGAAFNRLMAIVILVALNVLYTVQS